MQDTVTMGTQTTLQRRRAAFTQTVHENLRPGERQVTPNASGTTEALVCSTLLLLIQQLGPEAWQAQRCSMWIPKR